MILRNIGMWLAYLLWLPAVCFAQEIDLSRASIMASESIKSPVRETAIRVIQEEVAARTAVKLPQAFEWGTGTLIILATVDDQQINGIPVPHREKQVLPESKNEGFRITMNNVRGNDILWLIGADERGVIYAIGEFLREARLSPGEIIWNRENEIASSPVYPVRGHQLGYRNTANSWDAWTADQFETYIRELALFGANTIENTPFHDGGQTPLMKMEREEMNIRMSEICHNYGLNYRIWTPAEVDLSDPDKFEAELARHVAFYKACPDLDGVFFPGGDPGHNAPEYVMPFLEKLYKELQKYHPEARLWISLQGFSDTDIDYFYDYLDEYSPDWLTGVTTGPGSPGIAETRFRLPDIYQHTLYPDITHTVRSEYPVKNWDQAFALTEGREVSNPQPFYYAEIFHRYAPFTDGFVSYSDGVHDDVNKVMWSQLGWNPEKEVRTILEEYVRFFFGSSVAGVVDGILALENNWEGPIEENGGIESAFAYWQILEDKYPELKENWRWQLLLLRAYYDTYTARRKIYEQGLEEQANHILSKVTEMGSDQVMKAALHMIHRAETNPEYPGMRQKIVDLCEALFQSIGLQTSVEKYQAKNPERGAILDFLDYPLNNRWWLADEFDKIRQMKTQEERLDRIETIWTWENPGPGSYYDDVSDISQQPHVTTSSYDATDIAWWDNGMSRERLSTQTFQNFPRLVYDGLDPDGRYKIRIAGEGEALLRVNGVRLEPMVYNKGLGEFKEFHVPWKLLRSGKLVATFDEPEESHLNWRKQSKVCDVWLLKGE